MGYDLYFELKDKKLKDKYKEICKKEKISNDLFWASGWDTRGLAEYLKSLGEVKITKTDDPHFDIEDWIMPVSKLHELTKVYTALKDAGICDIFDKVPTNYDNDLDNYFYDEVLGWKYENQADELVNDMEKYADLQNESIAKAIRLADLEYADNLRAHKAKLTNDFNGKVNKALDGVDYILREYIVDNLPWSIFNIERAKDMYDRLIKVFDKDVELVLSESY